MPTTRTLFDPIKLGEVELPNRILMSSMTRSRTTNPDLVPTPLQAEYYRQRASAGLILTEGTWPSAEGIGAIDVPGLFTEAQADGWKRVTQAVHDADGRIFVQLGHCGASSHPSLHGGRLPPAPSAVNLNSKVFIDSSLQPTPVPRAMELGDIERTVADYAYATRLARKAGFDGVELHGIVGYLIPEFLNDRFNLRVDRYGGSIENRARFPLEVLQAMIAEWRPGRIGMKLSPSVGMADLQPTAATVPTHEYLVSRIAELNIAYLHFYDTGVDLGGTPVETLNGGSAHHFRTFYAGPIVANGGLDKEKAEALISSGAADAVSFAARYMSNPDLVERFRRGHPLAPVPTRETWYGGGAKGYVDFPRAG